MNYTATINYSARRQSVLKRQARRRRIQKTIMAVIGMTIGAVAAAWFIGYCIDVSIDQGNAQNCDDVKRWTHDYDATKAKCSQYYQTGNAAYLRQSH